MKIAIPTTGKKELEENVSEHFGRCQTYTFLDENGNIIDTIDNTSSHMGGTGLPPELLKNNDVDILLCHGIGPKALHMCKEFNIKVYVNKGSNVHDIFHNWKNNDLSQATTDDVCKEHHS